MGRVRLMVLALMPAAVMAQEPLPTGAELAAETAKRFPQPVQVGRLVGHDLLQPIESQPVLGRVEGVRRAADGAVSVVVSIGGVLGFGTRPVTVPVDALAFLGPQLALVGYTPAQLSSLPTAGDAPGLPADTTVMLGLVRPFH